MQVSVALCGQQQQKLNQAEIHYKAGAGAGMLHLMVSKPVLVHNQHKT